MPGAHFVTSESLPSKTTPQVCGSGQTLVNLEHHRSHTPGPSTPPVTVESAKADLPFAHRRQGSAVLHREGGYTWLREGEVEGGVSGGSRQFRSRKRMLRS